MEKMNTGSIYCIDWSSDGTQVAIACGSGAVLTAHIIDKYVKRIFYICTMVFIKIMVIIGN